MEIQESQPQQQSPEEKLNSLPLSASTIAANPPESSSSSIEKAQETSSTSSQMQITEPSNVVEAKSTSSSTSIVLPPQSSSEEIPVANCSAPSPKPPQTASSSTSSRPPSSSIKALLNQQQQQQQPFIPPQESIPSSMLVNPPQGPPPTAAIPRRKSSISSSSSSNNHQQPSSAYVSSASSSQVSSGNASSASSLDPRSFMDLAREELRDSPRTMDHFLLTMKEFRTEQISMNEVVHRITRLFRGRRRLLEAFNRFLPENNKLDIEALMQQQQQQQSNIHHHLPPPTHQHHHQFIPNAAGGLYASGASSSSSSLVGVGNVPVPSDELISGGSGLIGGPPGSFHSQQHHGPHHSAEHAIHPSSMGGASSNAASSTGPHPWAGMPPLAGPPSAFPSIQQQQQQRPRPTAPSNLPHQPHASSASASMQRPSVGGGGQRGSIASTGPSSSLSSGQGQYHPSGIPSNGASTSIGVGNSSTAATDKIKKEELEPAVKFIQKIRSRFAAEPEIFKSFLDIVDEFQMEQKTLAELYAQINILFAGHPDLIENFRSFLPEQFNSEASSTAAGTRKIIPGSSVAGTMNGAAGGSFLPPSGPYLHHHQHHQSISTGTSAFPSGTTSNGTMRTSTSGFPLPPPPSSHGQMLGNGGGFGMQQHHHSTKKSSSLQSSASAASAKRPRNIPSLDDYRQSSEEFDFFENVKNFFNSKAVYGEFLKCLNLFNQDMIGMRELIQMVSHYLARAPDLFAWFKRYVGYSESSLAAAGSGASEGGLFPSAASIGGRADEGEEMHEDEAEPSSNVSSSSRSSRNSAQKSSAAAVVPGEIPQVDVSVCKKYGSYRILPRAYRAIKCSGRGELEREVLNDDLVGCPQFASEEGSFIASKKNQFEEALFKCEDDRFELDMLIDANLHMIHLLEALDKKIQAMDAEERSSFKLGPSLGLGISTSIPRKALSKIYGVDRVDQILEGLQSNPQAAVPVVLQRCLARDEEWKRVQREYQRVWREIHLKNYYKALDHQSITFKATDKKTINVKSLINEIEMIARERSASGSSSTTFNRQWHVSLMAKRVEILKDLLCIIKTCLKSTNGGPLSSTSASSSSSIHRHERKRIARFLESFLLTVWGYARKPSMGESANGWPIGGAAGAGGKGKSKSSLARRRGDVEERGEISASSDAAASYDEDSEAEAESSNSALQQPDDQQTSGSELETSSSALERRSRKRRKSANEQQQQQSCSSTVAVATESETVLNSSEENCIFYCNSLIYALLKSCELAYQRIESVLKDEGERSGEKSGNVKSNEAGIASKDSDIASKDSGIASKDSDIMDAEIKSENVDSKSKEQTSKFSETNAKSNSPTDVKSKDSPSTAQSSALPPSAICLPNNPHAISLALQRPTWCSSTQEWLQLRSQPALVSCLCKFVSGAIEQNYFEEKIRFLWGPSAFHLFTFDKLITSIIRQTQTILSDPTCDNLLRLFDTLRTRPKRSFTEYSIRLATESLMGGPSSSSFDQSSSAGGSLSEASSLSNCNIYRIELASPGCLHVKLLDRRNYHSYSPDNLHHPSNMASSQSKGAMNGAEIIEEQWSKYIERFISEDDYQSIQERKPPLLMQRSLRQVGLDRQGTSQGSDPEQQRTSTQEHSSSTKTSSFSNWIKCPEEPWPHVIVRYDLECKISVNTYKMFFVEESEDFVFNTLAAKGRAKAAALGAAKKLSFAKEDDAAEKL